MCSMDNNLLAHSRYDRAKEMKLICHTFDVKLFYCASSRKVGRKFVLEANAVSINVEQYQMKEGYGSNNMACSGSR